MHQPEPLTTRNMASEQCIVAVPGWGERVLQGATVLLTAAALFWIVFLAVGQRPPGGEWALQALMAGGVVAAGAWASAWRYRHWTRPLCRLIELLPDVREGDAPIDSLSEVTGGPATIIPLFQELLHELRKQRAEISRLEFETRQRVASRTNALERALGSMREQAARDPLTGLYNRRILDDHLPRLVEQHKADRMALCLMMIDVDHFKQLNDTLGHAAGDDLLRSIGQLIRSSIREADLAFRCGGDEFVVLLNGCEGSAAQKLADRLAALVDALVKPLKLVPSPGLSIGVSRLADMQDATPAALLEEADRLLYEIKAARRSSRRSRSEKAALANASASAASALAGLGKTATIPRP